MRLSLPGRVLPRAPGNEELPKRQEKMNCGETFEEK